MMYILLVKVFKDWEVWGAYHELDNAQAGATIRRDQGLEAKVVVTGVHDLPSE